MENFWRIVIGILAFYAAIYAAGALALALGYLIRRWEWRTRPLEPAVNRDPQLDQPGPAQRAERRDGEDPQPVAGMVPAAIGDGPVR